MPDVIEFRLAFALPSLNARDKLHWRARHAAKNKLQLEVLAAIGGSRYLPLKPWRHVTIDITRFSSGRLDRVNLYGACKGCEDVLKALGVIEDDKEKWCDLRVTQDKAPRGAGFTTVRVEKTGG